MHLAEETPEADGAPKADEKPVEKPKAKEEPEEERKADEEPKDEEKPVEAQKEDEEPEADKEPKAGEEPEEDKEAKAEKEPEADKEPGADEEPDKGPGEGPKAEQKTLTKQEVQHWFKNAAEKFEIDIQQLSKLKTLNGKALQMLKKEDWIKRSPDFGDILFNMWQEDSETGGNKKRDEGTWHVT